jgi:hypothetical protein
MVRSALMLHSVSWSILTIPSCIYKLNAAALGRNVRADRTRFVQPYPAPNPGDMQALDVNGVADGIRTHNNWNHKGAIGDVTLIKSNTSGTRKRPKTHKKSR